jgi:propionyl-CoA carboxylase alpha chain
MFDKILIANRGEIAVRIIRTCKHMGIRTVAVYSDVDSRSVHRRVADEAVHIGEAQATESYLNAEKMISAAVSAGCRAIHPGYGFLSENPQFVRSVEAAGLVFIGPPAGAMAMLGDKITSKELAVKAGVPVVPGHSDSLKDEDEAIAVAESIGYPVLLKPAGGGGGKGMRIVHEPNEMEAALMASRQEARKAFSDGRIFMERYIERPRHVEIQILADAYGKVVYLGERECSIQRRYQKIIEESPSPFVSDELRQRMGKAACDLARRAGYRNAGTVEFILDSNGGFYFLEMNTRLQVEHPVTEMVTGLDLVELQIRIAAGEPLPFDQTTVKSNGWAMEARICAEDPLRDFMPSTGMITRYAEPRGGSVRVDSGVNTGSQVGIYYDSMLAKVICHGKDREAARIGLVEALNGYHIEGVVTNLDFVNSVLSHPEFIRGHLSTGFIEQHFKEGHPEIPPSEHNIKLAALAAAILYHVRTAAVRESLQPIVSLIGGKKHNSDGVFYKVRAEKDLFEVQIEGSPQGRRWRFDVRVNEHRYEVETPEFEFYRRRLKLMVDGQTHRFRMRSERSFIFVAFCGIARVFEVYTPKEWRAMEYMPTRHKKSVSHELICPMPGLVVEILVKNSDRVFRGQDLVVLESMKMESGVPAPVDGEIADVRVAIGQVVERGDVLIRFEANQQQRLHTTKDGERGQV